MNYQAANIRTESGLVVRTSKGRRRPVVQASPFAVCPTCGAMDWADAIEAGNCTGCKCIEIMARRERQALAAERRDEPANSEENPY
jgi:hypothetical protein